MIKLMNKEFLDKQYKLFIGGEWVDSKGDKTFDTYSPINGELLSTCVDANKEDVDLAVKAASKAFETWKDTSRDERAAIMMKLADKLESISERLYMIETMNTGKAIRESSNIDIPGAIGQLRYFASAIKALTDGIKEASKNSFALIVREPMGVVGQIVPWNFPFSVAMQKIAPALAAGNTIVIKPSSETPLSLLEFAKASADILPPGVVNVITGKGSTTGNYILEHEGFKKLDLTGSTEVGYVVAEASAKKLIPATLELGGKSANIVFPDCNWKKALDGVKMGITFCSGQVCSSGSRVFVHEDIYDKFLEDCIKEFNEIRVGDPFKMESQVGSLCTEAHMKKVLSYIDIGKKEGARVACGGYRLTEGDLAEGCFIRPTILADVKNDMRVAQEEIFGSVACFIKFKDEDDAIKMANDSDFGLAGGVWTQDINRALRVAKAIETGYMWVNTYAEAVPGTPFGGHKKSGYGYGNDLITVDEYSKIKTIFISMNENPSGWYSF